MTSTEPTSTKESSTGVSSLLSIFKVIAHKKAILLRRYPVNTTSMLVPLTIFFLLVFYGGQAVAGPALTDSLDGIIVGFFLFTLAATAFTELSWEIMQEAQWGTLERLYMSPYGFGTVMILKSIVGVLVSFLMGAGILLIMTLITGRWLTFDPLTVVPLVIVTLLAALGIGFAFSGMALVFKRIENAFPLVQFAMVGLVAAPVGSTEWLRILPISHGSYLLRQAMSEGVRLWEFPLWELGLLVVTNLVYVAIGYACLHYAVIKARNDGLMGHY